MTTDADHQSTADAKYRWNSSGFAEQTQLQRIGTRVSKVRNVSTPQGTFQAITDGSAKSVTFGERSMIEDDPILNVASAPCLPLGQIPAGFQPDGPNAWKMGKTVFRPTRDAKGRITQIDRIDNGLVTAEFDYLYGASMLPTNCTYQTKSTGTNFSRVFTFSVVKLGVQPPLSELLTNWNQPGVNIVDRRVSPEVVWKGEELAKANRGTWAITPNQLLDLSKTRSQFFAREIAKQGKPKANNDARGSYIFWIVGLTILVLVCSAGFTRFRGKTKGANS